MSVAIMAQQKFSHEFPTESPALDNDIQWRSETSTPSSNSYRDEDTRSISEASVCSESRATFILSDVNSESGANPEELSNSLDEVLRAEKCYETKEGLMRREQVLKSLDALVKKWIEGVNVSRGMRWEHMGRTGGGIVTYGSHKLGISHQGADIDALCVAPQHITREEFFKSFFALLRIQPEVRELRAIEEAFVPVVKMNFSGIDIDMTFARISCAEIPSDPDFLSNIQIKHLEPKCIRSLNGFRSTALLLKLVPNIETFQMTLRAIKLWAKRKGLYSNSLGFLGGFSWAVLVAKTCMLNPGLTAAELVHKFFEIFSTWKWPTPVALNNFEDKPAELITTPSLASLEHSSTSSLNSYISSWNPSKNPQEKHQVMPVITPVYPHMNSTFNVSHSTLTLIQDKMEKALEVCQAIQNGKEEWNALFKTNHIFEDYEHILIVSAQARDHIQWFGLIESKIRHFLINIESDNSSVLQFARIWPKPFTKMSDTSESNSQQLWFIGLQFKKTKNLSQEIFDFSRAFARFKESLVSQARIFLKEDMAIAAKCVRKSDLTAHLTEDEIREIMTHESHIRVSTPFSSSFSPTVHTTHHFSTILSSPSYATVVTNMAASSGASTNNNYIFPKHQTTAPIFPNVFNIAALPPAQTPPPVICPPPINVATHQFQNGRFNDGSPSHGSPRRRGGAMNHIIHSHSVHNFGNRYSAAYHAASAPVSCRGSPGGSSCSSGGGGGSNERTWSVASGNYGVYGKTNNHGGPRHGNRHSNNNSIKGGNNQLNHVAHSPGQSLKSPGKKANIKQQEQYQQLQQQGGKQSFRSSSTKSVSSNTSRNKLSSTDYDHPSFGYSDLFDGSFDSLESEHGRSISYSSDQFPPHSIIQARVRHGDKMLPSPTTIYSSGEMVTYDSSVPPPFTPFENRHHSPARSNSKGRRNNNRNSNLRLSSSDLRDISTPLPVVPVSHPTFVFNFTTAPVASQLAIGSDSVFH